MIARDYITEWRQYAPWVDDAQIEQDLVISRALVELFSNATVARALAFRGGTALYKLHLTPALRYSEDIDLVQVKAESAGPLMDALHAVLDPWLGAPRWKQTEGRVTFVYRFLSEAAPPLPMRLKVEINTREHFAVHGFIEQPFAVESRWFSGNCRIQTYTLDELLATKLRALYQRRKGRDLFDLEAGLQRPGVDPARIVDAFRRYIEHGGHRISQAQFQQNLDAKLADPTFMTDMSPLLAGGERWDPHRAAARVSGELLLRLPGGD
jgi:predicted nucleotidyltransferase component of viral defense system